MKREEALEVGKALYKNITLHESNIISTSQYIDFIIMAIRAINETPVFNKSNKQYIIDEKTLLHLLARESELTYLECAGVDNWSYYGEGQDEYIREELETLLGKPLSEDAAEDLEFEDIAKEQIKTFSKLV